MEGLVDPEQSITGIWYSYLQKYIRLTHLSWWATTSDPWVWNKHPGPWMGGRLSNIQRERSAWDFRMKLLCLLFDPTCLQSQNATLWILNLLFSDRSLAMGTYSWAMSREGNFWLCHSKAFQFYKVSMVVLPVIQTNKPSTSHSNKDANMHSPQPVQYRWKSEYVPCWGLERNKDVCCRLF